MPLHIILEVKDADLRSILRSYLLDMQIGFNLHFLEKQRQTPFVFLQMQCIIYMLKQLMMFEYFCGKISTFASIIRKLHFRRNKKVG